MGGTSGVLEACPRKCMVPQLSVNKAQRRNRDRSARVLKLSSSTSTRCDKVRVLASHGLGGRASDARQGKASALGSKTMSDVSGGTAPDEEFSEVGQICAVLGTQWGDEGKGKLVDAMAQTFDVVARAQGGANAGHTIYSPDGTK